MSKFNASLTIAANGRVVIPAAIRSEIGIRDGGNVIARVVDGAVILEPIETAIRRAQAEVRKFVPANVSLADELIAERRAAAAIE